MKKLQLAGLILSCVATSPAWAAEACSIEVHSNDAMQFDTKVISIDQSCKQFTVNLSHTGKMPRATMGHNWVLTTTADMQKVANDGMAAGLGKDYVKAGDARVIASTKVIGGGEKTSVTFDTSKLRAGEKYAFFCSFPGHWSIMKGDLALK